MSGDIIEQMRMRAIDVLRGHGWTVTDMSGKGYAQLDEAIEAVTHILLQDMRKQNARARLVSQKDDKVPGFLDYYATEFLGLTSEDEQA